MTGVFYLIAVFFFALLISFASYVIIKGFSGATPEMFRFLRKGSIGNQLFNTIYLVFISLVFSVPLGVTAGIYLSMYAKKGLLTKFLRICIETLSSLPSIVVGLFGYLVFLVFFGLGKSLLAGALSVSILAIPVITTTTEDAINGLPGHYLQASLGLGATRWQSIYKVVIPAAGSGILSGIILGLARAFGEALAVAMVIGQTTALPKGLFSTTKSLTTEIAAQMGNATEGGEMKTALWTMALLLFLLSLLFILLIHYFSRPKKDKE